MAETFADQPHMVARVKATQATVNKLKGRPFKWGGGDCSTLVSVHLTHLGHRPKKSRFGLYTSPISALKALQKMGFSTMADVLDDFGLARIPPAAALPGDVLGFGHPDQVLNVGLAIVIGNGRVLGFMDNGDGQGQRCHVFPPVMTAPDVEYLAWRAAPLSQEAP